MHVWGRDWARWCWQQAPLLQYTQHALFTWFFKVSWFQLCASVKSHVQQVGTWRLTATTLAGLDASTLPQVHPAAVLLSCTSSWLPKDAHRAADGDEAGVAQVKGVSSMALLTLDVTAGRGDRCGSRQAREV